MVTLLFIAKTIWLALAIVVGFVSLCICIVATFTWLTQSAMDLIDTIRGDRE